MKTLLSGLLVLALLLPPTPARACGPFFSWPIYAHSAHPDRPFDAFAAGQLGVLRETFQPMYLAYSWRVMMGIPTTPDEQRQVVESWARSYHDVPIDSEQEAARWRAARSELTASLPAATVLASTEVDYSTLARIHGDAFLRAERTLRSLTKDWKQHPALVAEWVRAQDKVFGPCAEPPALDPGLDAGLPPPVAARRQAEHAYQVAAENFYCDHFPEAATAFQRIAEQADSPYRVLATYLVARTHVRQALLERHGSSRSEPVTDEAFIARLTQAATLLDQILAQPALREVHAPARRLRSLVHSRLHPQMWSCELMKLVLEPGTGSALGAELVDLDLGFQLTLDPAMPGYAPDAPQDIEKEVLCISLPTPVAEMADWMAITRTLPDSADPAVEPQVRLLYDASVARWKQTGHLPWLVTALLKARVGYPGLQALLDAAARVPSTSPAAMTLVYRSAHLLRELGQTKAARARLATMPPARTRARVSSDNYLREERFALARDWDEAALNAMRPAAGEESDDFSDAHPKPLDERPVALDARAVAILNPRLTARRLAELAAKGPLTTGIRRQARWTAFARAVVVGDDETLQATAKSLAGTEPSVREALLTLATRPSPEERLFEAQLLLMDLPGVSALLEPGVDRLAETPRQSDGREETLGSHISHVRNGWCLPEEAPAAQGPALMFPSPDERKAADAEWRKVIAAGDSMRYLGRAAVAWTQAHPEDPRSPLALYRVVRASKKACVKQTAEAREAFRLLQRNYGKSELARSTKYYY